MDEYQQGKADAIEEIAIINEKHIEMLIDALNNTEENPVLHNALEEGRCIELRVRLQVEDTLIDHLRQVMADE